MPYEPQPDSLPAQVVGYFRNNPDEHLTLDDITDKFQLGTGRSNIHTLLARALDSELLKREKSSEGDWIYRAGKELRPVNQPVFQRKAATKRADLDPSALVICDDPLPAGRASPGAKYVPVFSAMKPGQAIKCKPEEVARVGHAMRKWITKNGKSAPEPEPVMGLPAEKSPAVTPPEMAQIEPPEEITIEDPAESTEVFPIEEVPTAMEEESLYAIDLGVGGTLEPCGTDRQMAIDRALHHAQVTRGSHRVYRLVPIGEAVPMVSAQFVAS